VGGGSAVCGRVAEACISDSEGNFKTVKRRRKRVMANSNLEGKGEEVSE
jgi:hypothetical protein